MDFVGATGPDRHSVAEVHQLPDGGRARVLLGQIAAAVDPDRGRASEAVVRAVEAGEPGNDRAGERVQIILSRNRRGNAGVGMTFSLGVARKLSQNGTTMSYSVGDDWVVRRGRYRVQQISLAWLVRGSSGRVDIIGTHGAADTRDA
jgi:hypothetical protein